MLVETPPIRRLFIPSPRRILLEADLKRADPQVVAKESGEEALLQVFRDGADVYSDMGKWLYEINRLTQAQRQYNKNGINACDYAAEYKTMAATLHTTEDKAKKYIERWRGPTGLYPGIGKWHRQVDAQLKKTNTVHNVYGFRRFYTDRYESLLPKALAWIASSTVSVTINRGMKHVFGPNVYSNNIMEEDRYDPWSGREYVALQDVQLLLQIHDSIICQIPAGSEDELVPQIVERMEVDIPYDPPLKIPVTVKLGIKGESWGELPSWEIAA